MEIEVVNPISKDTEKGDFNLKGNNSQFSPSTENHNETVKGTENHNETPSGGSKRESITTNKNNKRRRAKIPEPKVGIKRSEGEEYLDRSTI